MRPKFPLIEAEHPSGARMQVISVAWLTGFALTVWFYLVLDRASAYVSLGLATADAAWLVVLFVATTTWLLAVARQWVGESTGYGFTLASFGLASHLTARWLTFMCVSTSWEGWSSALREGPVPPGITSLLGWCRNLGLVAYGLGLGLVLLSCIEWRRSLRRDPWWVRLGS